MVSITNTGGLNVIYLVQLLHNNMFSWGVIGLYCCLYHMTIIKIFYQQFDNDKREYDGDRDTRYLGLAVNSVI